MVDNESNLGNSRRLSEVEKAFSASMTDVIATMAGIEPERASKCEILNTGITGAMTLAGEKSALAAITMPIEAAIMLVSYMTGIYASELGQEDVCDGIAELVNMVCGRAKVMLSDSEYHFNLTSPFVIIGENHDVIHKSNVAKVQIYFRLDDMVIRVQLTYP